MSKPTVGIFGLTGCAGDQLAILNCEDRLLDLVALIDIRDFCMASSDNRQPHCAAGRRPGGGRGADHARRRATARHPPTFGQTLVALGTCAVWGGVAAMDRGPDRAQAARRKCTASGAGVRFAARRRRCTKS